MKILVLEDNERLATLIKSTLEKENFEVDIFLNGEKALDAISNGYYCYILDINVPLLDGISLLKTIRLFDKKVPIIIISANHELEKIQKAYEIGCDDYLKKPFFNYELVQKVKKLCKVDSNHILEIFGGYKYDCSTNRLFDDKNQEIKLAKKEILFLEMFIKNRDRIVTFSQMEEFVWEGEDTSVLNMRALIKRFRKKLPEGAIESVKEIGYILK